MFHHKFMCILAWLRCAQTAQSGESTSVHLGCWMDVYCAEKIASKVRKVSKSHIGSAGCQGMDKQITQSFGK